MFSILRDMCYSPFKLNRVLSVPALRLATLIFLFTAKTYYSKKGPDEESFDTPAANRQPRPCDNLAQAGQPFQAQERLPIGPIIWPPVRQLTPHPPVFLLQEE